MPIGKRPCDVRFKVSLCLQARQDFNQVKDIAGQAGRKFSNLAQNFIKDLQGGY